MLLARKIPVRIISDIMPLIDQVTKDMVAAMKNREEARLSAIRMVKAAPMKKKFRKSKCLLRVFKTEAGEQIWFGGQVFRVK